LQQVADELLSRVDCFSDIFDVERAPESFVDLILQDLGNPLPVELTELDKRRLASMLVETYRQKGTAVGIRNAIRLLLGLDIQAVVAYADSTSVLDGPDSGIGLNLGSADRFPRYAFSIEVDVVLTDKQRRQIRALVEYLKPAHTHFLRLVEATPPPTDEDWTLGESELPTG